MTFYACVILPSSWPPPPPPPPTEMAGGILAADEQMKTPVLEHFLCLNEKAVGQWGPPCTPTPPNLLFLTLRMT